jgi:hypothetical protein
MQALELRAEVTKDRELRLKLPREIQHGTVRVIVLYEEQVEAQGKRQFGQFKGQITISEDFDAALPAEYNSSAARAAGFGRCGQCPAQRCGSKLRLKPQAAEAVGHIVEFKESSHGASPAEWCSPSLSLCLLGEFLNQPLQQLKLIATFGPSDLNEQLLR